jgi:CheY-like chemotaxis protein
MVTRDKPVLVVEDDRELAETIAEVLEEQGYFVVTAANGREALALIEGGKCRPLVILLDLMMPVMDGWEFQRRLQNCWAHAVPVIVCTADGHAREKAESMNAAGHLVKPPTLVALVETVERFCESSPGVTSGPAKRWDGRVGR